MDGNIKYYPLTHPQKSIWYTEKLYPGTSIGTISATLRLKDDVDYSILEKAINIFIEKNDGTRLRFNEIDNEPVQYVSDYRYVRFNFYDFSKNGLEKLYKWDEEQTRLPFNLIDSDLFYFALIKIDDRDGGFLVKMHHLISDAWTMSIVGNSIVEYYYALKNGIPIDIESKPTYLDYIIKEDEYKKSNRFEADKQYWNEKLDNWSEVTSLKVRKSNELSTKAKRKTFLIPKKLTARIREYCSENSFSEYVLFFAALSMYINRVTAKEDIILGTTLLNRSNMKDKNTTGMFTSAAVPTRISIRDDMNFKTFIEYISREIMSLMRHQRYPYDLMAKRVREQNKVSSAIFDIVLSFQNSKFTNVDDNAGKYATRWHFNGYQIESLLININDRDNDGRLIVDYDYLADLFYATEIDFIHQHIINLLWHALDNPEKSISRLEMLSEKEKSRILYEFNDTNADYPKDKTIHQIFEEQVKKTPDNIAVVFGEKQLTYNELDEKSGRLAWYLRSQHNIKPESLVGVMMDRSEELITILLGILKAGGAYVPVDPDYPFDMIKNIIDDSGLEVVVSNKRHINTLNKLQWECKLFNAYICIDCDDVYAEEEIVKSKLMSKDVWEYVGKNADDDIAAGAWVNSYTGEDLSSEEMEEYSENVLTKLKPYLNKDAKVLEIGCASGLSMYKLAPYVGMYFGTDLSEVIIKKNRVRIKKEGLKNIKLACVPAHDINLIDESGFDIVIINSVIQCFHGYNYLRGVISKATGLIKDKGIIFIGDIMDHDKKDDLIQSMIRFKTENPASGYRTKTDWSVELFVSKGFFEDLLVEMKEIVQVGFSDKIYTIKNELTEFRYDAIISIDKKNNDKPVNQKHKIQHGINAVNSVGKADLLPCAAPENAAYIIYTSGTSGKPKGVVIEHRNVVRLMFNDRMNFNFTSNDIWTMFHSYCFDFSVWEMYGALLYGGKLIVITKSVAVDTKEFLKILKNEAVTVLNQTPSAFYNLMNEVIGTDEKDLKIRYVIFGGEALKPGILKPFKDKYPDTKLINMYGITETTVHVSFKELSNEDILSNISNIGRPIPTLTTYIMDKNLSLLPIGISGEICVGGDGVARGYLNRPELTAEKFIANPYIPNERMYRSGDCGRLYARGDMEYLGRIDNQVKIRGYRIELGDIEKKLLSHELIKNVVAIAKKDTNEKNILCAYIVMEEDLAISDLRAYLSKLLPDYMIPSYFVKLSKLPLTSNGKVNVKALPDPIENLIIETEYVPPRNEMEETLINVCSDLMKIQKMGINDNIFNLGADSLTIIQILTKIYKYNWGLSASDFYKYPTVMELSDKVNGNADIAPKAIIQNIEKVPSKDEVTSISQDKKVMGNVLLTGSTGFLGMHILRELINTSKADVYCLIRGKSEIEVKSRFTKLLDFYFDGEMRDLIEKRIFVVSGDVTIDYFGLSFEEYEKLGNSISSIIHSSALVKYYGDYKQFEKVNVNGTSRIIDFAKRFNLKLNHISTIGISGSYLVDNEVRNINLTERDFYLGQNYTDNVYVWSKFEAENLVLKEINNGMNASIMRMGNLTGRYSDGHFQPNIQDNAFYNTIKSIIQLGAVPEELLEQEIEFTPVDLASKAVVKISGTKESAGRIFHVFNHNEIRLSELLDFFKLLDIKIEIFDNKAFKQYIENISSDDSKREYLSGIINDFDESKGLNYDFAIKVVSVITQKYLGLLGFEWPSIDLNYIIKLLNYMKEVEYLSDSSYPILEGKEAII